MSHELFRHLVDITNKELWIDLNGECIMGKYCKLYGFVDVTFDCEGCTLCEGKDK